MASIDTFFKLSSLPPKAAIVGAGYIAVELAGIYSGLGCETHLFIRYDSALRKYRNGAGHCWCGLTCRPGLTR